MKWMGIIGCSISMLVAGSAQADVTVPACVTTETLACSVGSPTVTVEGFKISAGASCWGSIRYKYDYRSSRLANPVRMAGTLNPGKSERICPEFPEKSYTLTGACVEGAPGCSSATPDSETTLWLRSAFENSNSEFLRTTKPQHTLLAAWLRLKACRDAGNTDLNLAAAEHYAFARLAAQHTGDTTLRDLPKYYELIKKALGENRQILSDTDQPVSPPAPAIRTWGEKGVDAGLRDYRANTGKEPTAGPSAVALAYEVISKIYREKRSSNAKCELTPY